MVGGTKTVRFRVSGKVQGVGFRWYTRQEARELGVLGRVRNLPDGHVEVVATGSDEQLDTLRRKLLEGPPGAHVTGLDEQEQHGVPFPEAFEIDR